MPCGSRQAHGFTVFAVNRTFCHQTGKSVSPLVDWMVSGTPCDPWIPGRHFDNEARLIHERLPSHRLRGGKLDLHWRLLNLSMRSAVDNHARAGQRTASNTESAYPTTRSLPSSVGYPD